ncbi:hypothetical protein OJAV_G00157970 [Oryzias javanicus]|uniref:Uncharacterized protein n=1 Tax=Oryzias javanicus TaxID=123683 RepID=A0A437CJ07_ORYJA|nr:hypothetical protein OJAV_G00157970 [Oryzias javanicus]
MQSKSKEQIRGGVTFQQANAEQFADVQRHLCGSAHFHHLKMMRLLFLSLLLLLPATPALSNDYEGSTPYDSDDEDDINPMTNIPLGNAPDKSTGSENSNEGQVLVIAIVVAVAVLVLTIVIVAVTCVRRRMQNREQGIYTVPTEQNHKTPI